jgi:hypothetical protein
MIVLMKSWSSLNLGHVGSKSRSLGQIIEKPCLHSRGHNIDSIFIKLAHNDCLDEISVKLKSGLCGVKK